MKEVIIGITVVIIILTIIYYFTSESSAITNYVSAKQAQKMIKNKQIRSVVDVRSESEYQSGHYPDAISFPLNTINEQTVVAKETGEQIYEPTLVYCRTGKRAQEGAALLKKFGIQRVYYTDAPYWILEGI